jgi:hypothetical protein
MRGKLVVTLVLALSTSTAAHADSMRCGNKIVNESATLDELVSKCGQPKDRKVVKEDQYAINPNGARVKTGGQTVKERWIYQPTPGALPMAVQILDGKIVSITRAQKPNSRYAAGTSSAGRARGDYERADYSLALPASLLQLLTSRSLIVRPRLLYADSSPSASATLRHSFMYESIVLRWPLPSH